MQSNKVRVEVVSVLPSYCEVLQDAMGELEQLASDHKAQLAQLQVAADEAEHQALHRIGDELLWIRGQSGSLWSGG